MPDLALQFGADLALSPSGDIATMAGTPLGQQRVLRRLLTNAGGYIWQIAYGAGLGQAIGAPGGAAQIEAAIRSQLFAEPLVARTPQPVVSSRKRFLRSSP